MMKKIIFCTTICLFVSIGLAIAQSIHDDLIENKVFKKIDSKWFAADKKNSESFYELDQNVITIKFAKQSFVEGDKMMQIEFDAKSIRKAQTGYVDYKLPQGRDFFESLKKLKSKKEIEDVVINTIGVYHTFTPNDQHFNDQWHLGKILMPEVWDFVEGNPCIVVAIIDSGTDWLHEDIGNGSDSYNNLYHNTQEGDWTTTTDPTTGNGIDDDGNGFVDDWIGWDFENQDNDARAASNSHGTQVAGITSAKTHNTVGVAGVGGGLNNQGVLLMPIKIGESAPIGNLIDDAILYAIDNGADVIQMSLGVNQSNAIDSAIQAAENADIAVVCASGNDYRATINYPASNQNVFSVGATDQNDHRCDFSNYGNNLFMAAPGKDIYSTTLSNGYGDGDGTSFAAPQVSGVIALLKRISPNISNDEVRTVLMNTADKVGGYTYTNGRCNELGYGRLDAYAAVQSIYPTLSGPDLVCSSGASFTVNNPPQGATITWSCGGLTRVSAQGSNPCTFAANSGEIGTGYIWATINTSCDSYSLPYKSVNLSGPHPDDVHMHVWSDYEDPSTELCANTVYHFYIYETSGHYSCSCSNYSWSFPAGWSVYYTGGGLALINTNDSPGGLVEVTATTSCCSENAKIYSEVWPEDVGCDNGYFLMLSPNPSTSETIVSIESSSKEAQNFDEAAEWDLEVYNQSQLLKTKKTKLKGREYTLNTSAWKPGVYIVRVNFKGEVLTEKLMVKE